MSRSRHRDGAHGHHSTLESMSAIFMAADPDVKPVRRHQSEPSRVPANLTNQPRELPLLLRRLRFRTAARGARSPASRRKTTSDQGRTGHGARPGARARAKELRERAKMTSVAAAVIARRVGRAIGFPQWCARRWQCATIAPPSVPVRTARRIERAVEVAADDVVHVAAHSGLPTSRRGGRSESRGRRSGPRQVASARVRAAAHRSERG